MIDGFFIYHLVNELNTLLAKSRLEKIVMDSEQSFVFYFYHQGKRKQLYIDLSHQNFSIYVTKKMIHETLNNLFVSTLKKHLEGAILEEVTQHMTDRVILLHFTVFDFIDGPTKKTLVFEAMGKHSNLLLIKDNIIIETYKKMFFETGRQLLPQATFEFFPSNKQSSHHIDYSTIESPHDLVNRYLGISPMLSKYLFDYKLQWKDLVLKPTLNLTLKRFYACDLFDIADDKAYYPSLSDLLDDRTKQSHKDFLSQKQFIEKFLQKLEQRQQNLYIAKEESYDMLKEKDKGDAIYQSGFNLNNKQSHIDINGHIIVLDPTKTLNENAQIFYKRYQKAKRGINHIEHLIKDNQSTQELFKEYQIFIDMATQDSIKELEIELASYGYKKVKASLKQNKKVQKPKLLILRDDDDTTYTIGKNSTQNEYLTHTLANKDDYWFHVQHAPGAHVVVNRNQLNEVILRKAAMLAAYFSGMKHSSSIAVDYTHIKHVKKIPGVVGYKVTYKHQQTIYIDIDDVKINSYLKNV